MIRSMTGFGRKEKECGKYRVAVEMKAVNHRYLEIVVRLPRTMQALEDRIKKAVATQVRRGRVEVHLSVERASEAEFFPVVQWDLVDQYVSLARQLQTQYGVREPLTVRDVLTLPGVLLSEEEGTEPDAELEEVILDTVHEAAADMAKMKEVEGRALRQDLEMRLQHIADWTKEISAQAPEMIREYERRLKARIREIASDLSFDEQRIAQEVVLYADRSDVTEETTRMFSHCEQFASLMLHNEAVGRKLDFLLQEMNREANTIASKAQHLPIQRLSVDIKAELEKMREQVQNVE